VEKCYLSFASRTRSEQSDEQSAEQLQEVDHPEARIAHRGICASPDAIFGSHSHLPEQFLQEARASLPAFSTDAAGDIFASVCLQRIRLRHDQQLPEWEGGL
jgi:hypothetical protein